MKHSIKTVNTLYSQDNNPGVAKTCFKTFVTFCKNVLKDPTEPKFRKINLDNENVQKRITKLHGGMGLLKAVGFKEDGSFLVMDEPDLDRVKEFMNIVENYL